MVFDDGKDVIAKANKDLYVEMFAKNSYEIVAAVLEVSEYGSS